VTATPQGSGATLHVSAVVDGCSSVKLGAECAGGGVSQIFQVSGPYPATVTLDMNIRCPCGADVLVTVSCADPGTTCTPVHFQGAIDCGGACCVAPQITYSISPCNVDKYRPVTFTTTFNIPATVPSSCFPMSGQLQFGVGTLGGANHVIPAPGTYSFTDTNLYNAAVAATYTATFVNSNPSCPPVSVSIPISPCIDCCPQISNVDIAAGKCRSDCKRAVRIRTYFSPPAAGCQAAVLQWVFTNSNNQQIVNVSSNAFATNGSSPDDQTFIFDPADAPITATLNDLTYPNCGAIVRTIDLSACDSEPQCPTINSFSAKVDGCENVGGKCLRRVDFTLDVDVFAGCGASAGTEIRIDFGDNDHVDLQLNGSGQQIINVTHHYASGGTYPAAVATLNPPACPGAEISVSVPDCASADCGMPSPCPELPKPPPWCLCKLCYIFSQKSGKGWCKAILVLVALYVSLVIVGVFLGWINFSVQNNTLQNLSAALQSVGLLVVITWYQKECSPCCAACALLLGVIIAVIAVITIALTTTEVTIMWWKGIVLVAAVLGTWWFMEAMCKAYAGKSLTQDTWCKD